MLGLTFKAALGVKFKVTYNTEENLRAGKIEPIPAWSKLWGLHSRGAFDEMFAAFGLSMTMGDTDFDYAESMNAKFPEIETTKLADMINKYWSKERDIAY